METTISATKQLRKQIRAARQALSPDEQQLAAENIVKQAENQHLLDKGKHVAIYLANDGELDPHKLVSAFWQRNATVALPVLHPFCQGHLLFLRYQQDCPMQRNKYGIPEPVLSTHEIVLSTTFDQIYVPLVAFDKQGNRLGMGGGYYDRTLNTLKKNNPHTLVIGLAHDCQEVEALTTQKWDVPMHAIVTPSRFLDFRD